MSGITVEQILKAEIQHYLRTKAEQSLRRQAMEQAQSASPTMFEAIIETYLEECTNKTGPSHLELIERLLLDGGTHPAQIEPIGLTPVATQKIEGYLLSILNSHGARVGVKVKIRQSKRAAGRHRDRLNGSSADQWWKVFRT